MMRALQHLSLAFAFSLVGTLAMADDTATPPANDPSAPAADYAAPAPDQGTAPADQPAMQADQPAMQADQPAMPADEPAMPADEPAADAGAGPPPLPAGPPPLPAQAEEQPIWYVERDGKPYGPITGEQFRDDVNGGLIGPSTLVWREGWPEWQAASAVEEMAPLFQHAATPAGPDWNHYLLGVWQVVTPGPQGMVQTTTLQYLADGTFNGTVTLARQGMGQGAAQRVYGTWSTSGVDADSFSLTLNMAGSDPVTSVFHRVDDNTVTNEAEGYQANRVG